MRRRDRGVGQHAAGAVPDDAADLTRVDLGKSVVERGQQEGREQDRDA